MTTERVRVLDIRGRELSPCDTARARRLVAAGAATWVPGEPPAIRLAYAVEPASPRREPGQEIAPGTRLLLHLCCGPCATYTVPHLRERGFDLLGWWYNPNVQPGGEHELREASAQAYAARVGLPVAAGPYEPERFERAVGSHAARPERCQRCYQLRLEEAARATRERGIVTFTTTLLISPYQDQAAIREAGEEAARQHGVHFVFESLRRGWLARGRLAREYGLYLQQYCGCLYSLAERQRRAAPQAAVPDEER
jgi:predicted adenine nucleotide alpha hydrolase (AANH) superfamily ATPase